MTNSSTHWFSFLKSFICSLILSSASRFCTSVCSVCVFWLVELECKMPNNRRAATVSRITEDEMNALILKLQEFLPQYSTSRSCTKRVSASKILKETNKYLKKLQKEVDDLSERLSQLLACGIITTIDADAIRTLLAT